MAEKRRRIAAYGLCTDPQGRFLLVRASAHSNTPGVWSLPGGGIEHGEDPADAAVREFAEETGLTARVTGLHAVISDVTDMPWRPVALHHDRIVYDMAVVGGDLRAESDGTSDVAAWLSSAAAAAEPLLPFTAELIGAAAAAATGDPAGTRPAVPDAAGELDVRGVALDTPAGRPRRVRRFGVYALATDPAGQVLLTLIAPGYSGAGLWHLPGGGTDHGEQPVAALLRELAEESDQLGRVVDLLEVSSLHEPTSVGLTGQPVDWQGIRVLYRVIVDTPTEPRVTEAAGTGSTAQARWCSPADAALLPLTAMAEAALALLPAAQDSPEADSPAPGGSPVRPAIADK